MGIYIYLAYCTTKLLFRLLPQYIQWPRATAIEGHDSHRWDFSPMCWLLDGSNIVLRYKPMVDPQCNIIIWLQNPGFPNASSISFASEGISNGLGWIGSSVPQQ